MKQRVKALITTPTNECKLHILSVHEVDKKLLVICHAEEPEGCIYEDIAYASDACVVTTSAQTQLPVIHYLTGVSELDKGNSDHISNFGTRHDIISCAKKQPSKFTSITDVNEIADLLAKGKCIFKRRTDGLRALRLSHFERAEPRPSLVHGNEATLLTQEQMQGVINIYPLIDDGVFKIIVESICEEQPKKSFIDIYRFIQMQLKESKSHLKVEDQFFMDNDDQFSFTAVANGKSAQFTTHAVEFSLPVNSSEAIRDFMQFLDKTIKLATKAGPYTTAYTHVQISQQSVLSNFEELFIGNMHIDNGDIQPIIVSAQTFHIASFYQQPGIVHEPESISNFLIGALIRANLPAYASVLPALQAIHPIQQGIASPQVLGNMPREVNELVKVAPTTATILHSKSALALRALYPECNTILHVMEKSGILNDSIDNIKSLFANVILACRHFYEPQAGMEQRESIDALVDLYKLLEAKNDAPTLLTLNIHQHIIDHIARTNHCHKVVELAKLVGELDAIKIDKLLLAAHEFIKICELAKAFDDTNECFLYIFNSFDNDRTMKITKALVYLLEMQQKHGDLSWLRKKDFKFIVDKIDSGKASYILSTLGYLNQAGATEAQLERFLQDINQFLPLEDMFNGKILTKDNIDLAFVNPDFGHVKKLCETYAFIGWWSRPYSAEKDKQFLQALLANPQLTHKIKLMDDTHKIFQYTDKEPPREKCIEEVAQLLKSAEVIMSPPHINAVTNAIKQGHGYFKAVDANEKDASPQADVADTLSNRKSAY